MPRRATRTDFASVNENVLALFQQFHETGRVEAVVPTRAKAYSLRQQIYTTRLLMQDRIMSDDLANELFRSAKHIYVECSALDPDDKRGPTKLILSLHPATVIAFPNDPTPWKASGFPQWKKETDE